MSLKAIINIYEPNSRVPEYMKQQLTKLKTEMDHSTIITGGFNTLILIITKIIMCKFSKGAGDLNKTIFQLDLNNMYHPFNNSKIYILL